jgi:transposase-like protein
MVVEANADHEDGYEQETQPCDMHCPALPQDGLNFWKSSCLEKQKDPRIKTCYGGCNAQRTKKLTRKRKDPHNGNVKAAIDLFNSGLRVVDIAKKLNINYSSVYRYIRLAKDNGLITVC